MAENGDEWTEETHASNTNTVPDSFPSAARLCGQAVGAYDERRGDCLIPPIRSHSWKIPPRNLNRPAAAISSRATPPRRRNSRSTPRGPRPAAAEGEEAAEATAEPVEEAAAPEEPAEEPLAEEPQDSCPLTPQTILEAMLFVGSSGNRPLAAREAAALMRGVSAADIEAMIEELNALYEREGHTYTIVPESGGFRLVLRPEFDGVRHQFYGRVREAKLSQAAVDVLAIVAYSQPVTREEVDRLRGKPSGGLLAQLVRRELLRLERRAEDRRHPLYHTTERFLKLFGPSTIADLPKAY